MTLEKYWRLYERNSKIYSDCPNFENQQGNSRRLPKNTTLYFSLLLETKDLLNATTGLLEEYHTEYDSSVKPAKINEDTD